MRLKEICLTIALLAVTPALSDPGPPPAAADVRAFRECQDTEVRKLDDGKRAEDLVARDLAAQCEKQYQAMSAAVLRMFGKPAWMSNYESSLATVRANRDPNSPMNRQTQRR